MKKQIRGRSGFCGYSGIHHLCHATWETPSVIVTCDCGCHSADAGRVLVAKTGSQRKVLVPKK